MTVVAPMQPVQLESTTLASAAYDPTSRHLEIVFRTGERYLYLQVPPHCYQQLLQADSKGAYFNQHIRNCFPFQHLSRSHAPIVLASTRKTK